MAYWSCTQHDTPGQPPAAQNHLRPLLLKTNGTFIGETMGPEPIQVERTTTQSVIEPCHIILQVNSHSSRAVMCQQEPVPDQTLDKDILHGEEDGLGVDAEFAGEGTGSEGTKSDINDEPIETTKHMKRIDKTLGPGDKGHT